MIWCSFLFSAALLLPSWIFPQKHSGSLVKADRVKAHEEFLAGDLLKGRGSASSDEAIAAAYVASQFRSFGLQFAPGMNSYIQESPVHFDPALKRLVEGDDPSKNSDSPARKTYNAVGYLPGKNSSAGVLLITAHLDHLGRGHAIDGDAIYNGADDDASGTTAVIELARALSAKGHHRRAILFVCFGSEEEGDVGSKYFRRHPPVPLSQIIANVEFEMIGAQDPKLAPGYMLFTGWERTNLGPSLRAHGAKLAPDPYPEQHYFQRSDNYALAQKGIVAQTAAGWGNPPYYHQPNDDLAHLDYDFLTEAIQSMVRPLTWLANSNFVPVWNPGLKPRSATD
jgi:Zn-dependent M28 family amino/carboxypeptidase